MNKKLRGRFWQLLLLALVAFFLYSSVFTIEEMDQGVITTFGRYTKTVEPGLHFKMPWPIQSLYKVSVRRTRKLELGYYQDLEGGYHSQDDDNALTITGDMNVVDIDFFLEWQISDPVAWLFQSQDPESILEFMLASSVRSVVGTKTIDETLTTGKIEIQNEVKEMLLKKLEQNPIGVRVVDVKINNSSPPTEEVARAFRDVETAKQNKDTAINEANKYRNLRLPAARSTADQILRQAEAYKEARIKTAEGERDHFLAIYKQYKSHKDITAHRLYLETLSEILSRANVYVNQSEQVRTFLPLAPQGGQNPLVIGDDDESQGETPLPGTSETLTEPTTVGEGE